MGLGEGAISPSPARSLFEWPACACVCLSPRAPFGDSWGLDEFGPNWRPSRRSQLAAEWTRRPRALFARPVSATVRPLVVRPGLGRAPWALWAGRLYCLLAGGGKCLLWPERRPSLRSFGPRSKPKPQRSRASSVFVCAPGSQFAARSSLLTVRRPQSRAQRTLPGTVRARPSFCASHLGCPSAAGRPKQTGPKSVALALHSPCPVPVPVPGRPSASKYKPDLCAAGQSKSGRAHQPDLGKNSSRRTGGAKAPQSTSSKACSSPPSGLGLCLPLAGPIWPARALPTSPVRARRHQPAQCSLPSPSTWAGSFEMAASSSSAC